MKRNEIIELACKFGAYFELDFPDTVRSVEISPEGFFCLVNAVINRTNQKGRDIFQAGRDSYQTPCCPMNSDEEAWEEYLQSKQ